MAVTMKNAVFWHVAPCGSCKNRHFGRMHRLHHQGDKNQRAVTRNRSTMGRNMCTTANVVPSSPILVTLTIEEMRSSETSVLTRTTHRNIKEDAVKTSILIQ
jgi:hypothetical protein